jgi:sugar (pentulose or hexulose) kinase
MGLWLLQECRREWARQGEEASYDQMAEMAAQSPALQSILNPDDAEFFAPGDMTSRIRGFCQRTGQFVPQSTGEVVRCVLESLALKYRWVLERLEQIIGHRLEPIHIVGGGARNRLLNQFTANATGRAVVAGPTEATATGNILMQAVALGHIGSLREARAVVRDSFALESFEPQDGRRWDDAYGRLLDLMAGLT